MVWKLPLYKILDSHLKDWRKTTTKTDLECKLIQPLWKMVWRFLKKLGIKPPYDATIPSLGICPEDTKIEKDTCIPMFAAAAAKSLQSCPTLCDPIDSSPSGSPVPGTLQARILEWVAIFFSNAWKWKVKVKSLSRVRPSATPWTAAYQAPLSMGFSRQEYWSGVPLPSPLFLWGRF